MKRLIIAAFASALAAGAHAATRSVWTPLGSVSGDYSGNIDDSANWTAESSSEAATTKLFNAPGSYTVGLSQNYENSSILAFDNGKVTFNFGSYIYSWGSTQRDILLPYSENSATAPSLTIESGTVSNIASIVIGNIETLGGESLTLKGEGTRVFAKNLFAGRYGTNATARITDGAFLYCVNGDSNNNRFMAENQSSIVIDGGADAMVGGSKGVVFVGENTCSNRFHVSGAGTRLYMSNSSKQLRIGYNEGSEGNLFTVADGAVYTNLARTVVGFSGSNNAAIITNGASCSLQDVYVGGTGDGAGDACGNALLISGADTSVTAKYLHVGRGGDRNTVRIDGGSEAAVTQILFFHAEADEGGDFSRGFGNRLVVDGVGTVLTSSNDYPMRVNTNDAARITVSNGGYLGLKPSTSEQFTYIGEGYSASNVFEVLSGGIVTNGAKLVLGNGYTCPSNVIRVSGSGSSWYQRKYVRIGASGSFNELRIEDGGKWRQNGGDLFVGAYELGASNTIYVTGTGSELALDNKLIIGQGGVGNKLVVMDGGVCSVGGGTSIVSNNASVAVFSGGTLEYKKAVEVFSSSVVVNNATLSCLALAKLWSSTLELTGKDGYAHIPQLTLADGDCILKFTADRSGLPRLDVLKSSSTTSNIRVTANDGGRIEVDATECRVRGTFTLFSSANAMPQALRENIVTTGPVALQWSSDFKTLTATTTPNVGFVMLVR